MIAAILVAMAGSSIRVPHHPVLIAQAVIGCMIARSIPPTIIGEIMRDWPLFVAVVIAVIAASSGLGWLLTHWRVLPGTTAVWGSSPGAATAMMLMAAAYGADIRLVAFMQYVRVLLVAFAATIVARFWSAGGNVAKASIVWFPPISWLPFAETLLLVGFGALSARLRRIPAAPLLLPLGLGIVLQDAGLLTIELPPWLLAVSYAIVGWSTGLGFNRTILRHAAQSLPRVIMSILVLMAVCGGLAALLVVAAGIDPLTAYLATSPGGAELSGDHRNGEQRRCGVRDGDADHAPCPCAAHRPQRGRFHRQAGRCFKAKPLSSSVLHPAAGGGSPIGLPVARNLLHERWRQRQIVQ